MPDNETLSAPQGGDYLSEIIKAISSSASGGTTGSEQAAKQNSAVSEGGISALASLLSGGAGGLTSSNGVGAATIPSGISSGGLGGGAANSTGGGDLLSSLLSNPELLSKLPSIISAIKPFMEMMSAGAPTVSQTNATGGSVQTLAPPGSGSQSSLSHRSPEADSRTALLCAMKPYLSQSRRQAVDYIVKLGRLGDILKTL